MSVNEFAREISDVNSTTKKSHRFSLEQYETFIKFFQFNGANISTHHKSKTFPLIEFKLTPDIIFGSNWYPYLYSTTP